MQSSLLSAAIKAKVLSKHPFANTANDASLTAFCDAVAEAVVECLTAYAEVVPDTFSVSVAGPGQNKPVSGKGKIR